MGYDKVKTNRTVIDCVSKVNCILSKAILIDEVNIVCMFAYLHTHLCGCLYFFMLGVLVRRWLWVKLYLMLHNNNFKAAHILSIWTFWQLSLLHLIPLPRWLAQLHDYHLAGTTMSNLLQVIHSLNWCCRSRPGPRASALSDIKNFLSKQLLHCWQF